MSLREGDTMTENLPLFEQFPTLQKNLPFVKLGKYPTPVDRLEGISNHNQIYIKRDDLTAEEYGGNKIRKLEFCLGEALAQGAKEVLTFGCDGSNHALATGICAKHLGLQSISILRTQHNAEYVRKNLLKSLYYGIELHHFETLDEMEAAADARVAESLKKHGTPLYRIPMGGSSPLGNIGFVNAAFELWQQVQRGEFPEPDYIYVAGGTMGTAVGLMIGLRLLGAKTQVITVRVNGSFRVNESAMAQMLNDTATLLHAADPSFPSMQFTESDVQMEHRFFGEDYALFTNEGAQAVKLIREKCGIELEGTYTGKTFAALLDADQTALSGKTILFWNTLNSRDPHDAVHQNDYHELPRAFQTYFETEVQPLDR